MIELSYLGWLLIVPLILSLVALSARWLEPVGRFLAEAAHVISISLVLILSLFAVNQVIQSGPIFGMANWLHVDEVGAVFLFIIGSVGFIVGLYSIGYTRHDLRTGSLDNKRLSTYYMLFSLFLFTMLLVVTANNIIMMWVAVEATTLGSAFLVGIYGHRSSLEAAWKYVIICTVGVAFGLYGTVLVYADAFNLMQTPASAALWTEIIKQAAALDPTLIKMAFIFVLVGFGTKTGLFPMHAWLPDAHSEAPSPISALLSGVLLNCALLVILRFAGITNLVLGSQLTQILFLVFGSLSIAASAFFMYVQRDIKRFLAYSSMENMGLVVLAFGIGGPLGVFAGLLQAINHSLAKSLMFCTSGDILIKYRSRSLDKVKGMLQVMPGSSVLMIIGALALVGLPPFNIFVSKFFIISAGMTNGLTWLMLACLLVLMVVFAAVMRLVVSAVFGAKPAGVEQGKTSWLMLVPGVVLAALIVLLGVYIPPQLMDLLNSAASHAWVGDPVAQIALINTKEILLPLAHLMN